MLPIYFMYLAGTSEDLNVKAVAGRQRLITNAFGFVAGFTLVFLLLGATAAAVGQFLENNKLILQKISGIIMILFGLNFMGVLRLSFLNMEKRFHIQPDRLKFMGSLLFGIVFGFGWSPCLGAFLGSALLLAGQSGTVVEGMLLLLVYSAGLAIPFIVSAIIFEKANGVFVWLKKNNKVMGILSGILLITAGILVFTDYLKYLF